MREDEQFVIDALTVAMSATWRKGEDPPDAYLTVSGRTVAIEISTLTQHVRNSQGKSVPRLAEDKTAFYVADALNDELSDEIPKDMGVMLIMHAPVHDVRKTTQELLREIRRVVEVGATQGVSLQLEICGNEVELSFHDGHDDARKKVFAAVANSRSSADIDRNAWEILEDRIATKAVKCAAIAAAMPVWLALFNDYEILAGPETYRHVLSRIDVAHPFERIVLIGGSRSVATIWP